MDKPELRQPLKTLATCDFPELPPALTEVPTPLESLLDLLQGGASCALADSGIAAYDREHLDRLVVAAKRQAEGCLDHSRCLLELLDAGLASNQQALSRTTLITTVRHLFGLLSDYERLRSLADNAGYYRDHPEVADKVASYESGRRKLPEAE